MCRSRSGVKNQTNGEGGKTEGAGKGAGMGFRYKALAMVSKGLGKPAGF